ncbi:hypothetical protein PIB30_068210 [Stylosanthes scabra]|uniref:Uncharacterized protein n=1 Tax=Stylosanthes scabra TaxID=79078 RepID=A0ABU6SMW3_9FABA|nr:hypothetical protein [Stylosanthes scabra]
MSSTIFNKSIYIPRPSCYLWISTLSLSLCDIVMEVQNTARKKLTAEEAEEDPTTIKKLRKGEQKGEEPGAAPTEEEVEEFFAILRRMKVALDYFDQKGKGGREWREVLERAQDALDDVDSREDDAAAVNKSTGGGREFLGL